MSVWERKKRGEGVKKREEGKAGWQGVGWRGGGDGEEQGGALRGGGGEQGRGEVGVGEKGMGKEDKIYPFGMDQDTLFHSVQLGPRHASPTTHNSHTDLPPTLAPHFSTPGTIAAHQGRLGLMASPLKRQPDFEDGRALSRFITGAGGAAGRTSNGANSNLSAQHLIEPNAIRIAIDASSGDCVHHLLNAVLDEKVRGAGAGQGQGQCARQGACGRDRATTSEGQDRRILE